MGGMSCLILGVLTFLLCASAASAFNGQVSYWVPTASYYYAAPYYSHYVAPSYYYAWPAVAVVPNDFAGPKYARPFAAPPSETKEPPLKEKAKGPRALDDGAKPAIITTRALQGYIPALNRSRRIVAASASGM